MSGGWILTEGARKVLLGQFPPRYEHVVAHHVTLPGLGGDDPLPVPTHFAIVGRADDGKGVEAMVVARDGETRRIDGGVWHITWSLAEGRRAKESNDVLAAKGWVSLQDVPVETEPGRW